MKLFKKSNKSPLFFLKFKKYTIFQKHKNLFVVLLFIGPHSVASSSFPLSIFLFSYNNTLTSGPIKKELYILCTNFKRKKEKTFNKRKSFKFFEEITVIQ